MYLYREHKIATRKHFCRSLETNLGRLKKSHPLMFREESRMLVFDLERQAWFHEAPEFGQAVRYCPFCGKDLWEIIKPHP